MCTALKKVCVHLFLDADEGPTQPLATLNHPWSIRTFVWGDPRSNIRKNRLGWVLKNQQDRHEQNKPMNTTWSRKPPISTCARPENLHESLPDSIFFAKIELSSNFRTCRGCFLVGGKIGFRSNIRVAADFGWSAAAIGFKVKFDHIKSPPLNRIHVQVPCFLMCILFYFFFS